MNRYTVAKWIALLLAGQLSVGLTFAQELEDEAGEEREIVPDEVKEGGEEPDGEGGELEEEAEGQAESGEEAAPVEPVGALFDQLGAETARERIHAEKQLIDQLADDTKRDRIRDRAVELYSDTEDPEIWHRVREVLISYVSEYSDYGPRRGFLGVMPALVEYPDEDGKVRRAVRIEMVVPDTPAAKAKLQTGDLILRINDLDLDTPHGDLSFFRYTFLQKGGKEVTLKILRDWKTIEIDAVLVSRPIEMFANQREKQESPDELLRGWLKENGIELR